MQWVLLLERYLEVVLTPLAPQHFLQSRILSFETFFCLVLRYDSSYEVGGNPRPPGRGLELLVRGSLNSLDI